MPAEKKKFRISSALKNIIGQDLITNDFIAVFELVKNAFDANAKRVDIIFSIDDDAHPSLIIKDNGKGMDKKDIDDKWLFVAYSAKKEGVEDYRDKIDTKRIYAGAKGIGRFSCDRLGSILTLYSKKTPKTKTLNRLDVNWDRFEVDAKKEFRTIPVSFNKTTRNQYKLKRGTALEITNLRSTWDREKILSLKRSLEKLINPHQENDPTGFRIYIQAAHEKHQDKKIPADEPWNKVNGRVQNFVFEALKLKTTQIITTISADGKTIKSRLEDRGVLIYEILEKNPFMLPSGPLHDIGIQLFALNRSAKITFTRRMGVSQVEYGSVFLYKNGFRIHPFGDAVGGDGFAIDRRKQQGQSRYLGTRDLIGRVEINGINDEFEETSSRDGGLVQNDSFKILSEYFFEFALKRLERFTIGVIKYGNEGHLSDTKYLNDIDAKPKILEIIENLTKSNDVLDIHYDARFIDILGEISEQSLTNVLRNFSRIAQESNNSELIREAKRAEKRLSELARAKDEAEAEAESEREKADQAETLAEEKLSENLFLRSIVSTDIDNVVSLHHHIGIAAGAIENYISETSRKIRSGKPITEDAVLNLLSKIGYQAKKISSTTKFATKANFSLSSTKIKGDLCIFIQEYLENICSGMIRTRDNSLPMAFRWINNDAIDFETTYRPLEIVIILDNLISNSRKAGAKKISVEVAQTGIDWITIYFFDNGAGLKQSTVEHMFELGYTTTKGSGMGMSQISKILKDMGGSIDIQEPESVGAKFKIEIPRQ